MLLEMWPEGSFYRLVHVQRPDMHPHPRSWLTQALHAGRHLSCRAGQGRCTALRMWSPTGMPRLSA